MFGLTEEDIGEDTCEVLYDNWEPFLLFDQMSTQWRVGGFGATGLDYNVLPLVAKSVGIKKKKLPSLLDDIRILESEALKVMAEQRDSK